MSIFSIGGQVALGALLMIHVAALFASLLVIALGFWSLSRVDREWDWKSFAAIGVAIAYIGGSFYFMG